MKPPFWEVTISRRMFAGEESNIESVNCFANRITAEAYADRALHEDATLRIVVRHVEAVRPSSSASRWTSWSERKENTTAVAAGSLQFRTTI